MKCLRVNCVFNFFFFFFFCHEGGKPKSDFVCPQKTFPRQSCPWLHCTKSSKHRQNMMRRTHHNYTVNQVEDRCWLNDKMTKGLHMKDTYNFPDRLLRPDSHPHHRSLWSCPRIFHCRSHPTSLSGSIWETSHKSPEPQTREKYNVMICMTFSCFYPIKCNVLAAAEYNYWPEIKIICHTGRDAGLTACWRRKLRWNTTLLQLVDMVWTFAVTRTFLCARIIKFFFPILKYCTKYLED